MASVATTETIHPDALPARLRRWVKGLGFKRMPPLILGCLTVLILLTVTGFCAPLLAPYDYREQSLLSRLQPPVFLRGDTEHVLGTDHLGRDVLSRLLFAIRTTLGIAALGMLIGMVVGTAAGLLSGYAGGLIDDLVMFLVDTQTAVPLTLLTLAAVAVVGTSPLVFILIVGLTSWEKYARVVRGEAQALMKRPFMEASQALGASSWRLTFRHLLPNIASTILVLTTFNFSTIVLVESSLSFLGLGIQPPNTSLGAMLGNVRDYLISDWWLVVIPGVLIVTLTMTVSLIGDWLRDVLDPNLRH